MNIFYLDENPVIASQYHLDKHIVKMPLETAQILCTIHWTKGKEAPYKPTHLKHPCTLWVGESIKNYDWVCELGIALCKEYTYRYGKVHKCEEIINWCIINKPDLIIIYMEKHTCTLGKNVKNQLGLTNLKNHLK